MKLFVDDIRKVPDESWTLTRTIVGAFTAIDLFRPTEISLDHDISHPVTVGGIQRPFPCLETYMPVAKYIVALAMNSTGWRPKVTIHSSNPEGGERMFELLRDAELEVVMAPMGMARREGSFYHED